MSADVDTEACAFCELIAGSRPLSVAVFNDHVIGFMDAFPVATGHVLVVPRRHVASVEHLTTEEGRALWEVTQLLCKRIKAKFAPAVNLHLSEGAEAEQDVPHVHMHVIPRHEDDQVVINLPGKRAPRAILDRVAESLATD